MKIIITSLMFICLFQEGVIAQTEMSKHSIKKKEEQVAAKRTPVRKEVVKQKKKEHQQPVETRKKEPAPAHEKEVEVKPTDSEAVSTEGVAVTNKTNLITHAQHDGPADVPSTPVLTSITEPMFTLQEWMPWLLLGLIVGLGIYVFWTNGNINSKIKGIQRKLDQKKTDSQWEKTKPQISSGEVEYLINSSLSMRKVQEAISNLERNVEKLRPPRLDVTPVTPALEPVDSTFYMTGPTNNYFPSSARSNNRENTVYKFMLQPGGNEAKFELHTTGASINEIIKVVESYIKPACDEENLPSAGTRNIVTRTPGRAILENDKWIIKDKAVIRYE
jgi:hypothetical protein